MKIYLICAWYEVGIRHYTHNLLFNLQNSLPSDYELFVTLVLRNKDDNYEELKLTNKVNLEVVVTESMADNLFYKAFPSAMDNKFLKRARQLQPDLIFVLYDGVYFTKINEFNKIAKVLYTIHDLVPHAMAGNSLKSIVLRYIENKRRQNMLDRVDNLITNSVEQYTALKKIYPKKKVFFSPIPTFVTISMINGNVIPIEIKGNNNYILFFGRLEKYKGIEELVNAHIKSDITDKLVIAGSGKLWFDVPNDDRIILINRYIEDSEVKSLYDNCLFNVMPYTSVTQTSMMSIPFYFESPVMFSDLSAFEEVAQETGCLLCKFDDVINYSAAVKRYQDETLRRMLVKNQSKYYNTHFDRMSFGNTMKACFDDIVSNH